MDSAPLLADVVGLGVVPKPRAAVVTASMAMCVSDNEVCVFLASSANSYYRIFLLGGLG